MLFVVLFRPPGMRCRVIRPVLQPVSRLQEDHHVDTAPVRVSKVMPAYSSDSETVNLILNP